MASTPVNLGASALPPTAIFGLLADGAKEIRNTGFTGLVYGVIFVAMGYAIATVYQHLWQMTMGLTAGFFLLGPFLCCGIYDLSRQKERGYKPNVSASTMSWSRNWKSIAFFAAHRRAPADVSGPRDRRVSSNPVFMESPRNDASAPG